MCTTNCIKRAMCISRGWINGWMVICINNQIDGLVRRYEQEKIERSERWGFGGLAPMKENKYNIYNVF